MTAGPAKADRTKIAKLLGMLGSDHAGERDAAGLAAHRTLKSLGLTWEQVLNPPAVEHRQPQMGVWRQTVAQLLERPGALRPWEKSFLADLPKFRRISVKQRYVLQEIRDRVLGQGAK